MSSKQAELDAIFKRIATEHRALTANQQAYAIKEVGRVRGELADILVDYADDDGTIKRRRASSLLRDLDDIEKSLREHGTTAIEGIVEESSTWTTRRINKATGASVAFNRVNPYVLDYVTKRFGEDGLVLSDRIWRLSGEMKDGIATALRSSIIKGEGVTTMIAKVRKVYDTETWKIKRMVVTEGNTAYRAATAYNAQESNVVKALRVNRGRADRPNHECTILEEADKHGMGAGLYYPSDDEIYMMHPNCTGYLSYELN